MSSSRRGGTNKLLNYAEVERRCTLVTRISHMRQREMRDIEVRLLFILHAQKTYLTVYSPCGPSTPANGCHGIGTHKAHALRGVGSLCGAQAIRDLRTSHKSWI
jgi:hypothetical protein